MRVIAHIGHNWSVREKSEERAKKLVREAKKAGAHAVIVEYFEADKVYSERKMIKSTRPHEMPPDLFYDLFQLAKEIEIDFIGSPRHPDHVNYMETIGVVDYHLAMGEIKHEPLIEAVADVAGGVLVNTGLSRLEEIEKARGALLNGMEPDEVDLVLLHSSAGFPVALEDANLRNMMVLGETFFPTFVGIESYHSEQLLDYMAMAYGPAVIVRKLDLDDKKGQEAAYSITPQQLTNLCKMAALAPMIISPSFVRADGFTETDWDFRQRLLRCPQNGYLLPPEQ